MSNLNPVEAVLDQAFPTPEARRACPVTVVCMEDGWQVYGAHDRKTTADAMVATAMALVSIIDETANTPSDALSIAHTFSERIMRGVMSLRYTGRKDELVADVELLNASSRVRVGDGDDE